VTDEGSLLGDQERADLALAGARYRIAAAYRFVDIAREELPSLRDSLDRLCAEASLLGTLIVAPEGINFTIAGPADGMAALVATLEADPRFRGMDLKWSESDEAPFLRRFIKVKEEIIAFGHPEVRPAISTGSRIEAEALAEILDRSDDEVQLLDTRNTYETRLGTFRGAKTLDIDTFRAFAPAVLERRDLDPDRPIVTFCTGGIRCEKASAFLLDRGFRAVFQLDGGILRYHERARGRHFEGECFVYDRRVALDRRLEPTGAAQCYRCFHAVTIAEQRDAAWIPGVSCPHCADEKPRKRS
jgi:UPF0176 protein